MDIDPLKVIIIGLLFAIGAYGICLMVPKTSEEEKNDSKTKDIRLHMESLFGCYPSEEWASIDLQIRSFFMEHYTRAVDTDVILRVNVGSCMFRGRWFARFCNKLVEISGHDRNEVANRIVFYADENRRKSNALDYNAHMKDPKHPVPF